MMNIINGGFTATLYRFPEFVIRPVGASSFREEPARMGAEVFHIAEKVLLTMILSTAVGDERFAPALAGTEDALDSIMSAIKAARERKLEPGKDVKIGMDCTHPRFFKNGIYDYSLFEGENGKPRTADRTNSLLGRFD